MGPRRACVLVANSAEKAWSRRRLGGVGVSEVSDLPKQQGPCSFLPEKGRLTESGAKFVSGLDSLF